MCSLHRGTLYFRFLTAAQIFIHDYQWAKQMTWPSYVGAKSFYSCSRERVVLGETQFNLFSVHILWWPDLSSERLTDQGPWKSRQAAVEVSILHLSSCRADDVIFLGRFNMLEQSSSVVAAGCTVKYAISRRMTSVSPHKQRAMMTSVALTLPKEASLWDFSVNFFRMSQERKLSV